MANIQILGKIGKNVEVKQVGGSTVAQFSLAETVGYGEKKQTIWYDCSLWGKQAESNLVDYLNKGRELFVCGELTTFVTNDGKTYLKVRLTDLKMTSGTKENQGQQQGNQGNQQNNGQTYPQQGYGQQSQKRDDLDDPLPF